MPNGTKSEKKYPEKIKIKCKKYQKINENKSFWYFDGWY